MIVVVWLAIECTPIEHVTTLTSVKRSICLLALLVRVQSNIDVSIPLDHINVRIVAMASINLSLVIVWTLMNVLPMDLVSTVNKSATINKARTNVDVVLVIHSIQMAELVVMLMNALSMAINFQLVQASLLVVLACATIQLDRTIVDVPKAFVNKMIDVLVCFLCFKIIF